LESEPLGVYYAERGGKLRAMRRGCFWRGCAGLLVGEHPIVVGVGIEVRRNPPAGSWCYEEENRARQHPALCGSHLYYDYKIEALVRGLKLLD
jgi:hypothetical protein